MKVFKTILLLPVLLGLMGCNAEKEVEEEPLQIADPNVVQISKALQDTLTLHKVAREPMHETLRIPGRITVDEQSVTRIGASVVGRVTDIGVTLGQQVGAGQVLATLNSTELAQSQLSFIKAMQQVGLQEKAVERARLLLEAGVIGSAELLRREAELASAQADLNAARNQLQVLGMSDHDVHELEQSKRIRSISYVFSRLPGTVIERKVNQGQVVQPADELFMVANLSHVWAVAEVPESQIDLVEVGQDVSIEIPALARRVYTGKLIYVADLVDPVTRTVTVRTDLANPEHEIKPEMMATMLIQAPTRPRIAIPQEAVVRENNQDHVFVMLEPGKFRLRPVKLGIEYNGLREVISDLAEGETVVTTGAFHLNSERKRKELE